MKYFQLNFKLSLTGKLNILWLSLGCCCFLYNAWVVPMRSVFTQYQNKSNLHIWLTMDYFCDFIYILDILIFKSRTQFLKNGVWVTEKKEIQARYLKSRKFAVSHFISRFIPSIIFMHGSVWFTLVAPFGHSLHMGRNVIHRSFTKIIKGNWIIRVMQICW